MIDISAPGGNSEDESDLKNMCLSTYINGKYMFVKGTSFSTPKVSAVAALLLCQNNKLTPKEIKEKICTTADKLYDNSLPKYYGAGMLNAYNSLTK